MSDPCNVYELDERGIRTCECGNEYLPERPTDPTITCCPDCARREYDRTHPQCTCGAPAKIVADILVNGRVLMRRPWCSEECARGAEDPALPVVVDVLVDAEALPAVIAVAPCWGAMPGNMWCPKCGWKMGGNET